MLFLVKAHITITSLTSPAEGRVKSQGSVREIGTDLGLTLVELSVIFRKG